MRSSLDKIASSWRFLADHFKAENTSINRQIAGSLVLLIAGMVAATALPSIGIVAMGPSEYGRLEFTTSLAVLVALIASLGIESYALRHIPTFLASGRRGAIVRLLTLGFLTAVGVAAVLAVALYPIAQVGAGAGMAAVQFVLMPAAAAAYFLSFCVQSAHSRLIGALLRNTLLPAMLIMLWLGASAWQRSLPVAAETVVWTSAFYYAAAAVVALWLVRGRVRSLPAQGTGEMGERLRSILKSSLPMLVFSSSFLIVNQTDVIMIGYFLPSHEVSNFAFAAKLAALPSIGLLAVNILVPPIISTMSSAGRKGDMQTLMIAFGSFAGAAYVIVAALIVPVSLLLANWAGVAGWEWTACMIILLAGQAFNVLTGSCGYLLTMSGHQTIAARSTVIAAIANIALNLALLPVLGIIGVALATAISVAVSNVYMAHRAFAVTGVQSSFLLALK